MIFGAVSTGFTSLQAAAANQASGVGELQKHAITYNVRGVETTIDFDYGTPAATVAENAPATPTIEDGDYDYTFTAWSPAFEEVKGAQTYTAQYSEQFVPADIAGLQTAVNDAIAHRDSGTAWTPESADALNCALVEAEKYLNAPTAPGRTLQPEIDNIINLINNAVLNLIEEEVTYTITFVDYNDNVISQNTYPEGATVVIPEAPQEFYSSNGDFIYVFAGWDPAVEMTAQASVTYKAIYDIQPHYADTIPLLMAIQEAQMRMGEPDFFEKYANADDFAQLVEHAHNVIASNPLCSEQPMVDDLANMIMSFCLVLNCYEITFYCPEDIYCRVVNYGETPEAPDVFDYSDGDYDYFFTGWSPDIVSATADADYVPQYACTFVPAVYTENNAAVAAAWEILNTENADKIYTTDSLSALQTAIDINVGFGLGRTRQVEVDAATNAINNAIDGMEYQIYTVKYVVDGTEVKSDEVAYGETPVAPANPTKDPSVSTVYTFAGWNPAIEPVAGNATYTAMFYASPRMYTVTTVTKSVADASAVTSTQDVAFGATPKMPTPASFVIDSMEYTFVGWDKYVVPVDADAIYTAQYIVTPVVTTTYSIDFKYADTAAQAESGNYPSHIQDISEGEMPYLPAPADFTTASATYEFCGWDKEVAMATGDTTYTAQYTVTPVQPVYTINFRYAETFSEVNEGCLIDHIQYVNEGEMPNIPTPCNFVDGQEYFTFIGWDKEILPATDDAVYYAIYELEVIFVPDMSEIEELVGRYVQMVRSGLYVQEYLDSVKLYIDDIYDRYDSNAFTNQDEVDEMAMVLKEIEDACRKVLPRAVVGFKCAARTANAEKLVWNKMSGVAGYQFQISNAKGNAWSKAYTTKDNYYLFKGLTAGVNYKFRIRAYKIGIDRKYYFGDWVVIASPTLPKGTAVKLTAAKKAFTAKWTKVAGVSGYQVQYATNAKFIGAKTVTLKGASKYTQAIKNLKGGARYYVRIRTYKTIGGKNYFSAWSAAKAVTTKR